MTILKSVTVAALLVGGSSLAMAQNGLPTGGEPPVAGGAAGNPITNPGYYGGYYATGGYLAAPVYAAPTGYAAPGYAAPGYAAPGYVTGYGAPGYAAPVYAAPGYANGYAAPGYAVPGYAAPGYAVPGYAVPGYAGQPGYVEVPGAEEPSAGPGYIAAAHHRTTYMYVPPHRTSHHTQKMVPGTNAQ